ncbi:MFS transporter, putative [Bodo saltans]|uniref:MFS transporter, putative n=1 Tax=Bodo saltans TaxID=75058 RepID=A0A0S4JGY0_BODSA|nr:MFS transporter, putative [Bodo saltans]|eukprot:CUG90782.1 MFS transporter, putative [Bodo saltans]
MAAASQKTPLLGAKTPVANDNAAADTLVVEPMSRNVPKMFAYNFMDGASFSIWQAQVLQVLLYRLDGNKAVGWVSGAAGAAQVCAALIAGYSADVLPKQFVCRSAALTGLVGVVISLYAVYALYSPLFYISGVIWGVYMGLANSSSEALFADSIPSGRRADIYNKKWIVQTICWVVGYLMCMILFLKLGNDWTTDTMQAILYLGLSMHPIALALLTSLKDSDALKHDTSVEEQAAESEKAKKAKEKERRFKKSAMSARSINAAEDEISSTADGEDERGNAAAQQEAAEPTALDEITAQEGELANEQFSEMSLRQKLSACLSWRTVPYFVCFGDFIMAMGSGMTLRFIPLFFVNDYNINPALMMGVYLTVSFGTSTFAAFARFMADRYFGRVPTIFAIRIIGTTFLMYLAVVPTNTPQSALGVMLFFFIARNSCMNCTFGMSRSVVMDCVPKKQRGRWAAVESFSSFTWAGSATLGGYLADAHGYKYTFLITAVVHYIGSCMLLPAWIGSRKLEAVVMQRSKELRATKALEAERARNSEAQNDNA